MPYQDGRWHKLYVALCTRSCVNTQSISRTVFCCAPPGQGGGAGGGVPMQPLSPHLLHHAMTYSERLSHASVQQMDEASGATCTERTWLMLTDVVAAKLLARLSSRASTASLLSFRFTMSSSGTGTNGSSVSATTCTSRLVLVELYEDCCWFTCMSFSALFVSTTSDSM